MSSSPEVSGGSGPVFASSPTGANEDKNGWIVGPGELGFAEGDVGG